VGGGVAVGGRPGNDTSDLVIRDGSLSVTVSPEAFNRVFNSRRAVTKGCSGTLDGIGETADGGGV